MNKSGGDITLDNGDLTVYDAKNQQTLQVNQGGNSHIPNGQLNFTKPDSELIFKLSDSFEIRMHEEAELNEHTVCSFTFSGTPVGYVCKSCHDDIWVGGLRDSMNDEEKLTLDAYVHGHYLTTDCVPA